MKERPLVLAAIVVLLGFALAALATGQADWVIPPAILFVLCLGAYLADHLLKRRVDERTEGEPERAMADHTDSVPSSHRTPDDETPLGDTPEAHDEITPHDLPVDHPGRKAAEEQAAG